jgi:hypothetical protein
MADAVPAAQPLTNEERAMREEKRETVYRQGDEGATQLRDELLAAREARAAELAARVRPVLRRRLARLFAGGAGLLWSIVWVGSGFSFWSQPGSYMYYEPAPEALSSLEALELAWVIMAAAYALGWLSGGLFYRLAREGPALTGELYQDIDALKRGVEERLAPRVDSWEPASVALPLMALALYMPLTLHSVVISLDYLAPLLDGRMSAFNYPQFIEKASDWIDVSMRIVGHAHLVLAGFCLAFAARLRTTDAAALAAGATRGAGLKAVGWTTLAAAVPGVLFLALPPLITGATGVVFVPAMFALARRAVLRERYALAG